MTTTYKETFRCSVCGTETDFNQIGSTNEMGSPDLDTRPPPMRRSTMDTWVQKCPKCGYCASKISEPLSVTSAFLQSEAYRGRLTHPTFPELANAFLCQAILARESADIAAAGKASMHAAWVCDDNDCEQQARACRLQAAELLRMAEEKGQPISEQAGVSTAIRVDLLRRAGEFLEAGKLITGHDPSTCDATINRILEAQSNLIDNEDSTCHTIQEAMTG